MEKIGSLFEQGLKRTFEKQTEKKKGPRNERDELFEYFFSKLAPDYKAFTKKTLSKKFLAIKLSHLKLMDLYAFKRLCEDAAGRNYPFSKYFWGNLKIKPENWRK